MAQHDARGRPTLDRRVIGSLRDLEVIHARDVLNLGAPPVAFTAKAYNHFEAASGAGRMPRFP